MCRKWNLEINWMLPSATNTNNTLNAQYFPNAKAYELRTWYTLQSTEMVYDYEDLYHRQRHDLEGQRWRSQCHVIRLTGIQSRTKRSRNTKIARKVAHPTGNNAHQFQGQMSKVKVIPRRLMLRSEVHHIFRTERPTNFKLGTQMEYEDLYNQQVPWPPRPKVKVAMSHGASDRCWPISRERKVPETSKFV